MVRVGKRLWLVALVIVFCFSASTSFATDAKTELLAMAQKIASAKGFRVTIRMGYDVVQKSGQKIEFGEIREVVLQRPDRLRVDVRHSDGREGGIVFDGKSFFQYSKTYKVYGELQLPQWVNTVDNIVRFAVAELNVRMPLARIMVSDFPKEITRLTKEYFFVERDVLGPVPTDHLAARTDDVDYQVWIGPDKLPTRVVITYKNAPGQPQFWANFSHWKLNPKVPASTFTFKPPKGAEKIPFVIPEKRTDVASEGEAQKSDATKKK